MNYLQARMNRLIERRSALFSQMEEENFRDPLSMKLALIQYNHFIVCTQIENLAEQIRIEEQMQAKATTDEQHPLVSEPVQVVKPKLRAVN